MDEVTPPEAKSVSAGVRPIPFGMPALDVALGGLPSGTATLLAGAPDAGGDAFVYTHAAQVMLARHDPGLYPTDVSQYRDALPDRVVYLTFRTGSRHILHAMDEVLDQYQFDTLVDNLTLLDYSDAFLDLADVPAGFSRDHEAGPLDAVERRVEGGDSFRDFVEAVAEDLDEFGENAVVVVDSLSDLYLAGQFGLEERTLLGFLVGLREAAVDWGGLVHVLYNRRAEDVRGEPVLNTLMNGNVYFYSNDKGFDTYRTMRVGSFGGALDREEQVVFQTLIGGAGFRVKSTKKLGPSNW